MSVTYSGTMRHDLEATVDNVLAIYGQRDPVEVLAHARVNLTDYRVGQKYPVPSKYPAFDDDDIAAWNLLGELQFSIETNLTRLCCVCGEMEGLHSEYGDFCRDQRNPRYGTFQGLRVVSNTFEPFPDGRRA